MPIEPPYISNFSDKMCPIRSATKKLYLPTIDSAYETEFTAEVVAADENQVTLNQTLFYPLAAVKTGTLGYLMDKWRPNGLRGARKS